MSQILQAVILEPKVPATCSVIWLHGLGADGNDFVDLVPQLKMPENVGIRFIFPHAPVRPVTLNAGYKMPAWFDIIELNFPGKQDEIGIRAAEQQLVQLIAKEEQAGIVAEKIVLAGFSQGGALALHTGLRYPKKLAGLLGLSTFLPMHTFLTTEKNSANQHTPILLAHGIQDHVLPIEFGEITRQLLQQEGYSVAWHAYQMQHQVCWQEINDISEWLKNVLGLNELAKS